jgi:hypothetical protein
MCIHDQTFGFLKEITVCFTRGGMAGQTGGAIGLSLIFLLLFASRQKVKGKQQRHKGCHFMAVDYRKGGKTGRRMHDQHSKHPLPVLHALKHLIGYGSDTIGIGKIRRIFFQSS